MSTVCDRQVTWSTLVKQPLRVAWRHFRSCFYTPQYMFADIWQNDTLVRGAPLVWSASSRTFHSADMLQFSLCCKWPKALSDLCNLWWYCSCCLITSLLSRSPRSSAAKSARLCYVNIYLPFYIPNTDKAIFTKSSRKMGWNGKVKLLVSELSGVGVQKCHFFCGPSWTQLHEIEHGGKTDLFIEERKLSDCGRINFLSNVENHAKIRRIFWGAFLPISDSGLRPTA